jgi:hypothetical protein
MPVTKRLLKHIDVEVARGDRRCRRDRSHVIRPGHRCLTIQEEGTPFKRSYCAECALPILVLCAANLREIRDGLYPDGLPNKRTEPHEETVGEALVAKNRKAREAKSRAIFTETQSISPKKNGINEPPSLPCTSQETDEPELARSGSPITRAIRAGG